MRSPRRHSVWIEVFGIVLFGAVLLGGAGYLLSHAGGAAGSLGGGGSGSIGPAIAQERGHGGLAAARRSGRPAPPRPGGGLFSGSRVDPAPTGAEVPFSESWQEQATPELTGPSGTSSPPGGAAAGEGVESSGPTIASRSAAPRGAASRDAPDRGGGRAERGGPRAGDWQAEAQRLAGRTRALSNQLGQISRKSSTREEAAASEAEAKEAASTSGASASASSGPTPPNDPEKVPIGGLGWLAAVGLGYALKRLHGDRVPGTA